MNDMYDDMMGGDHEDDHKYTGTCVLTSALEDHEDTHEVEVSCEDNGMPDCAKCVEVEMEAGAFEVHCKACHLFSWLD